MEKEEITVVAQLLSGMKDAIIKLEKAQKNKEIEEFNLAKKEIISFQEQIDKIT